MSSTLALRRHRSLTRSAVRNHRQNFTIQPAQGELTVNVNVSSKMLCSFALPMLLSAACILQPQSAEAQKTSVGVDCSQIHALGLLKQDNMRAGRVLIECGVVRGGHSSDDSAAPSTTPPNIQVSNRSCSDAASCTKSEDSVWGSTKNNGQTIVVNYNDHNPGGSLNYTGTSVSTDAGVTFKEIIPPPFSTGHG